MAINVQDINLDDEEITDVDLQRVINEADRKQDANTMRRSAQAQQIAIERQEAKERTEKHEELDFQSRMQVNQKKFEEAQRLESEKFLSMMAEKNEKFQIKLAKKSEETAANQFDALLKVAKRSNFAAWGSAIAALIMVYLALKGP